MIRKSILTVSDLHRNAALYGLLSDAVSMHHPDVTVMLGQMKKSRLIGSEPRHRSECYRLW